MSTYIENYYFHGRYWNVLRQFLSLFVSFGLKTLLKENVVNQKKLMLDFAIS